MNTHTGNTHTGGKYIYEGAYGCTFYPSLPCTKTSKRKGLGKLFNNYFDFKQEEKIQNFIKKIDPNYEATIPYYGSCRVNLDKTTKSDEINKCNIANGYSVSKRSINQLMFKYGGDDLDIIINNMKKSNSNTKTYNKYKDLHFDKFIPLILPLVKCIIKIAKYGYLHADIKPPNILYNIKSNKLYLIDFGLLQKQRYITQSGSTLSFKYLYYPPEFIIMINLRAGVRDPSRLYNDVLENFEFYDYEKYINYLDFAKYKQRLVEFIKYATTISLEVLEKEFLKSYIKKLDIYSLGMSLTEIMYVTHIDKTLNIKNKELYDNFVKNILIDMIHPDPRYRLTPDESYIRLNCLYRLEKIRVKEGDILDFIDINNLKHISNNLKLISNNKSDKNDKKELYNTIIKNADLLIK